LIDSDEQEKLEYLSKNFNFLNQEGKEYLENVARQLLYVQYPVVRPLTVKKIRKSLEDREERIEKLVTEQDVRQKIVGRGRGIYAESAEEF
jgi:hypothetical protein